MSELINSLDSVTLDLALSGAKAQITKLRRDLDHSRREHKHCLDLHLALQSLVDSLKFDRLKSEELDDAIELLKQINEENRAFIKEEMARIREAL